jgi:hypothetical protein
LGVIQRQPKGESGDYLTKKTHDKDQLQQPSSRPIVIIPSQDHSLTKVEQTAEWATSQNKKAIQYSKNNMATGYLQGNPFAKVRADNQ